MSVPFSRLRTPVGLALAYDRRKQPSRDLLYFPCYLPSFPTATPCGLVERMEYGDIIQEGVVYRSYSPTLMAAAWLWYLLCAPVGLTLSIITLRDLSSSSDCHKNLLLEGVLKLNVITAIVATYGLPLLLGITLLTCARFIGLGAFLIIILSFLQVSTAVLMEVAMSMLYGTPCCESSLRFLGSNCQQLRIIEIVAWASIFPLVQWTRIDCQDLLANLRHMLKFSVPRSYEPWTTASGELFLLAQLLERTLLTKLGLGSNRSN